VKRHSGFLGFSILWSGQLLSAVGTRMTNFALGIWVWDRTGSATDMAMLMFSAFAATIVFSPLAGSLIDRLHRRVTIMLSDIGSAVVTAALLVLYLTSSVNIGELYAVNVLTGMFLAFQLPAYQATIAQMIERGNYVRANGMMGLVISVPDVFAPLLAAAVLAATSIKTVLIIDAASYLIAIAVVFLVDIPPTPERVEEDKPGFLRDAVAGFSYIRKRPSLLSLLTIMFVVSFLAAFGWVLLAPLVLASTGNSSGRLGVVVAAGAIGGALGGIALTVLPQTKDKMLRMLIGMLVLALPGRILLGMAHSVPLWSVSLFIGWAAIPFIDGYNQSIWQEKVDPAMRGRVFAVGQMVENLAIPVALGLSGPLADDVFEPAMRPGGALRGLFSHLVGTGPGSGIAVMYVLSGALGALAAVFGFILPRVRRVESLLPDAIEEAGPAAGPAPSVLPESAASFD